VMTIMINNTINKPIPIKIFGRQPVFEALRFGCVLQNIWIAKQAKDKPIRQIEETAQKKLVKVNYVDKNDIQKIVGAVVHQGVAAQVVYDNFIDIASLDSFIGHCNNPFILVLDQIQDPHNLGAIIRTAEITNADLVILPVKGSAPINATVAKTSAGALFGVKIHQTENITLLIKQLQQHGIFVFAASVSNRQSIYQVDFTNPTALVIGSEDKGIRKNIQTVCDELITIPQLGKLNSLNASVSTAIIMYEVIRQRYFKNIN
ncbi:MAG TPA: 23S rRNA (guanosine(2251)-2'-O)-methyltransferase RlmB, partial [Caldithrix sp.]|nr:23S rRNA (guanosine(2251)-2'-O)-methyltransferase RlmB [Caldithrix sp.]